jgi:hypothetical protein
MLNKAASLALHHPTKQGYKYLHEILSQKGRKRISKVLIRRTLLYLWDV